MLDYSGAGEYLNILESRRGGGFSGLGMPPEAIAAGYGGATGLKREKVKIKDQSASLVIAEGISTLSFEIGDTSIEISSTLPKEELLRLAESLERQ